MARRVFFSFHYWNDAQRAGVVRHSNITKDNYQSAWYIDSVEREKLQRTWKDNIKRWIDEQMNNTSVTVVLIWTETASRPRVRYELEKSWERWNWIVGVHINNIPDWEKKTKNKWDTTFWDIFKSNLDNKKYFFERFKTYDRIEDDWYNNFWKRVEEAAKNAWK
jgi:hypothetical protein